MIRPAHHAAPSLSPTRDMTAPATSTPGVPVDGLAARVPPEDAGARVAPEASIRGEAPAALSTQLSRGDTLDRQVAMLNDPIATRDRGDLPGGRTSSSMNPRAAAERGLSPAMAFFGLEGRRPEKAQGGSRVAKTDLPTLKTISPPAVIGSTSESRQTTGPLRQALEIPANALIHAWALPGSTLRVYNASVIEAGKPKLLKEVVVPKAAPAGMEESPRCLSGGTSRQTFEENTAAFFAAKRDGLVMGSIALTPTDDQTGLDLFLVTMQSPNRAESEPAPLRLHAYEPWGPDRTPTVDTKAMKLEGTKLVAREDYAITPGTNFAVFEDGIEAELYAEADDRGHLCLDLGDCADLSKVQVVALSRYCARVPVDLGSLGIGRSQPPTVHERMLGWDQAFIGGFLREPVDGHLGFEVLGLPDGMRIDIANLNAPGEVQSFTSQKGRLRIDVQGVVPGDALVVKSDISAIPEGLQTTGNVTDNLTLRGIAANDSGQLVIDGTYVLPEGKSAERIDLVLRAFPDLRRGDLHFALALFGPEPLNPGCDKVTDPTKMRRILEGAKLGSQIYPHWENEVRFHLEQHADQDTLEGFKMGCAYRVAMGQSLGRADQVAMGQSPEESLKSVGITLVERGKRGIVITGGYSPISGSHGPLTPEYVGSPDTYEFALSAFPKAPVLRLQAGGAGPVGWVNTNAILLTFGLDLSGGGTSFE